MRIIAYTSSDDMNVVEKTFTMRATLDGTLRESCSILHPVFRIQYSGMPSNWTHLFIQAWSRWYYITDIVGVSKDIIEISASVDVLESYHGSRDDETLLYGLRGYIARNQYDQNYLLTDSKYPVRGYATISRHTASPQLGAKWFGSQSYQTDTGGTLRYFMRVQGRFKRGSSPMGVMTPLPTLVCDNNSFSDLVALIRDHNTISTAGKALTEYIYDMGCYPCAIPSLTSTTPDRWDLPGLFNDLTLPTEDLDRYYLPLITSANLTVNFKATVTLPSTTRYFINRPPYTNYTVTFQPFGKFELDSKYFIKDTPSLTADIYFKVIIDFNTGNAILKYGDTIDAPVYLGQANVVYSLPLSSTAFNGTAVASSAVTTVAAMASMIASEGASAPAAVPAIAGATLSGASTLANPATSVTGGNSKIIDDRPVVEVSCCTPPLEAPDLFGELLCAPRNIKDVYGYTEISKIHLDGIPATAAEKKELEAILRAGVIFPDEE